MKFLTAIRPNRVLLSAACLLALSSVASAVSTVTVDGIKSAGEYTGGTSNGTRSILWYNDHNSIYTEAAGNMNDLLWEVNSIGGGLFSLNMFFEVPTYARRMIWKDGVDYDGTNFDPAWGIDKAYLDAYLAGSHHGSVKMDYKTQTESELFELIGSGMSSIKWQDEDGDGLADGHTWATSREYLISMGLATTTESLNFDTTSSIELMWNDFATEGDAIDKVYDITKMRLHLSDEAVGLPSIPDSGSSLLLLGLGLGALAAFRRRRAS